MADQGRWWKLWTSSISDPALRELTLEDVGRWCWFGAYLKAHGDGGTITIKLPGCALQDLFRVGSWDHVLLILYRFPNCETTVDNVSCTVTWKNWHKYQVDNAYERVKKWRESVTGSDNVTKKRREEKRRDTDKASTKDLPQRLKNQPAAPHPIDWPGALQDIKTELEKLGHLHDMNDPAYWQKQDAWIESTGFPIFLLTELKGYLADQSSKNGARKHSNLKLGFRRWLANAVRWKERDDTRAKANAAHRPKDAFCDTR